MHNFDLGGRLISLLVGAGIGFFLGYLTKSIRSLRTDVESIKNDHETDAGSVKLSTVQNIALFVVVVLTVVSSFISQHASNQSNKAVGNVHDSDIVTCQNGNDSRAANLELWNFIFDLSLADPHNTQDPRALKYLHRIQTWVAQIFRPHDCHDLTKKYPIPPSPKIIVFHNHKPK